MPCELFEYADAFFEAYCGESACKIVYAERDRLRGSRNAAAENSLVCFAAVIVIFLQQAWSTDAQRD